MEATHTRASQQNRFSAICDSRRDFPDVVLKLYSNQKYEQPWNALLQMLCTLAPRGSMYKLHCENNKHAFE
jgi:hypothetical protein